MKKNIILLVEDDELDVISVKRSFRELESECELHTAYNGIEALDLMNNGVPKLKPDIILLDLNMPKMNGIEFLKILRNDGHLKHIKVFVMTTSAEVRDREQADALGISGYIIKPLNYTDNTKRPDSMESFVHFHLRKILNNT